MKPEFDRFINKVEKTDTCWLWKGTTYRYGYGHFRRFIDGAWKMYKTHRYSYEIFKGEIPPKMLVLHSCDNPACVNPDHLRLGTSQDNVNDMISRNRKKFGRNPTHQHLSYEFAEMLRAYVKDFPEQSQKTVAEIHDISTAQLSRILSNKIWTKCPEEL